MSHKPQYSLPPAFLHRIHAGYPEIPAEAVEHAILHEAPTNAVRLSTTRISSSSGSTSGGGEAANGDGIGHNIFRPELWMYTRLVNDAAFSIASSLHQLFQASTRQGHKQRSYVSTWATHSDDDNHDHQSQNDHHGQPTGKSTKHERQEALRRRKREKQARLKKRQMDASSLSSSSVLLPPSNDSIQTDQPDASSQPHPTTALLPWNPFNGVSIPYRMDYYKDPLYHAAGVYYSQDASSQLLASTELGRLNLSQHWQEVGQQSPVLLDVCAAPGGKSLLLHDLLSNRDSQLTERVPLWQPGQDMASSASAGLVVSNEYDLERCRILIENLQRSGATHSIVTLASGTVLAHAIETVYADSRQHDQPNPAHSAHHTIPTPSSLPPEPFFPKFSYILIDAPCSGSGMFRKDPKTIQHWSRSRIPELVTIQRELLLAMSRLVDTRSLQHAIYYMTCAIERDENEKNVHWALSELNKRIGGGDSLSLQPSPASNAQGPQPTAQELLQHLRIQPKLDAIHGQYQQWQMYAHDATDTIAGALNGINHHITTVFRVKGLDHLRKGVKSASTKLLQRLNDNSLHLSDAQLRPWVSERSYTKLPQGPGGLPGEGMYISTLYNLNINAIISHYQQYYHSKRGESSQKQRYPEASNGSPEGVPWPFSTSHQYNILPQSIHASLSSTWLDATELDRSGLQLLTRNAVLEPHGGFKDEATGHRMAKQPYSTVFAELIAFPAQYSHSLFSLERHGDPLFRSTTATDLPQGKTKALIQSAGLSLGFLSIDLDLPQKHGDGDGDSDGDDGNGRGDWGDALSTGRVGSVYFMPAHTLATSSQLLHPFRRHAVRQVPYPAALSAMMARHSSTPLLRRASDPPHNSNDAFLSLFNNHSEDLKSVGHLLRWLPEASNRGAEVSTTTATTPLWATHDVNFVFLKVLQAGIEASLAVHTRMNVALCQPQAANEERPSQHKTTLELLSKSVTGAQHLCHILDQLKTLEGHLLRDMGIPTGGQRHENGRDRQRNAIYNHYLRQTQPHWVPVIADNIDCIINATNSLQLPLHVAEHLDVLDATTLAEELIGRLFSPLYSSSTPSLSHVEAGGNKHAFRLHDEGADTVDDKPPLHPLSITDLFNTSEFLDLFLTLSSTIAVVSGSKPSSASLFDSSKAQRIAFVSPLFDDEQRRQTVSQVFNQLLTSTADELFTVDAAADQQHLLLSWRERFLFHHYHHSSPYAVHASSKDVFGVFECIHRSTISPFSAQHLTAGNGDTAPEPRFFYPSHIANKLLDRKHTAGFPPEREVRDAGSSVDRRGHNPWNLTRSTLSANLPSAASIYQHLEGHVCQSQPPHPSYADTPEFVISWAPSLVGRHYGHFPHAQRVRSPSFQYSLMTPSLISPGSSAYYLLQHHGQKIGFGLAARHANLQMAQELAIGATPVGHGARTSEPPQQHTVFQREIQEIYSSIPFITPLFPKSWSLVKCKPSTSLNSFVSSKAPPGYASSSHFRGPTRLLHTSPSYGVSPTPVSIQLHQRRHLTQTNTAYHHHQQPHRQHHRQSHQRSGPVIPSQRVK